GGRDSAQGTPPRRPRPGRGDGRDRPAGDVPAGRAGRRVVRAEDAGEPRSSREGDEMTPLPVVELPARPIPPLVSIRDLRVELGGRVILHGVNAEIARGKVTALIGLNGSGKTTLLRALVREYPYRGEVRFHCGHDHTHPTPEHVGYVPQRLTLDS